jgi:hypothetical protein
MGKELKNIGDRIVHKLRKMKRLPEYEQELGVWMSLNLPVRDQMNILASLSEDPTTTTQWLDSVLLNSGLYKKTGKEIHPSN